MKGGDNCPGTEGAEGAGQTCLAMHELRVRCCARGNEVREYGGGSRQGRQFGQTGLRGHGPSLQEPPGEEEG